MKIIGHGQLQHHFWGDYSATIALKFATAKLAFDAKAQLPLFRFHPSHGDALIYHGTGAELKAVEALLVRLGANRKKLTSLARSIDYGEPFTVTVDLTTDPTEVQLSLLGEN